MSGDGSGGTDTSKILLIVVAAIIGIPVVLIVLAIVGGIILFLLSAVLGTFVLGLGGEQAAAAPQANFDFQTDGSEMVVVTHDGGETMPASSVRVEVDGYTTGTWADHGDPGTVSAGDSITLHSVRSGDTVRLVWEGPDGESRVLDSYTVP
ncbi:type IV pilin [Halobacteriales archaeon QS_8_69_26]|nr:MAG: type IV pilin [Halobacteriales archaeon QS_8_69_26]